MKTSTTRKKSIIHDDVSPPRKCRWCKKLIKPVKGCWFQVFCTGGLCRSAYHHDQIRQGMELIKKQRARA